MKHNISFGIRNGFFTCPDQTIPSAIIQNFIEISQGAISGLHDPSVCLETLPQFQDLYLITPVMISFARLGVDNLTILAFQLKMSNRIRSVLAVDKDKILFLIHFRPP